MADILAGKKLSQKIHGKININTKLTPDEEEHPFELVFLSGQKEKRQKEMSTWMPGTLNKSGFSLIELMVVIALMGLMATIGFPSYRPYFPALIVKNFWCSWSRLTSFAWRNAQETGKIQSIFFDTKTAKCMYKLIPVSVTVR